ncbi:MAG TPA: hypothetical protein VF590_08490 [Isosphaeraceae bacterium]|jgi:hypothetical protein
MANPILPKTLADHLSRVRLTTYEQLVDYLLSSQYTESKYPPSKGRELARRDAGKAIREGVESGKLVKQQVVARSDNPHALLLLDIPNGPLRHSTSFKPTALPPHFEQLHAVWSCGGRKTIEVISTPKVMGGCNDHNYVFHRPVAEWGADSITAELVVSRIYFGLPPEKMKQWISIESYLFNPRDNSYCPEGRYSVARSMPDGTSISKYDASYFAPLIKTFRTVSETAAAIFCDFIHWAADTRYESSDSRFQIWMPDPETILP